ncbi:hypothetical protein B4065_1673 [Caldibacillus thermoamylovorans]|nr:hypothetical protein B4065_1673 [Caldibacillus thermoamylovorans]
MYLLQFVAAVDGQAVLPVLSFSTLLVLYISNTKIINN